jgi:hypothetical protein
MADYLSILLKKYQKKGIFIDTELLLLYLAGTAGIKVKDFGRTAKFSENDFMLVAKFIDLFEIKNTSPHILTETSDLIGNQSNLHLILKGFLCLASETYIESLKVAKNEAFDKFGLADTAIIELSKDSSLIFTNDMPFFGYLRNRGIDVISLNELRNL